MFQNSDWENSWPWVPFLAFLYWEAHAELQKRQRSQERLVINPTRKKYTRKKMKSVNLKTSQTMPHAFPLITWSRELKNAGLVLKNVLRPFTSIAIPARNWKRKKQDGWITHGTGRVPEIGFQIKFLDGVIGRPPSTTYGVYALLRGASSSPAGSGTKNIIWKPIGSSDRLTLQL